MTEQELRDKIIGIVLYVPITGVKIREILGGEATANAIADALISAGIGGVSEWKHRAEVAEEERDKAQKSLVDLCNEVAKIAIASDLVAIDNNTHKFFACKSDWSGTCKKCYFSCENYPFDMGRCEHNQYHWLNQQAEREIEEGKEE